jgi:hypothetical protein
MATAMIFPEPEKARRGFPRDRVWDTLRQSECEGIKGATAEFIRNNR